MAEKSKSDYPGPQRIHKLYYEDDLTQNEIADKFDVSQPAVSKWIRQLDEAKNEGKEKGRQEVTENPGDYDLTRETDDEETEDPYTEVMVPCCNSTIPTPDSAGKHDCPECGKTLDWNQDEI